MQTNEVAVISHLKARSWGRPSTPSTLDQPGRLGRPGIYLGRKLHGKPAMKHEIQAAIRVQRVVRGCLQRMRLREQEIPGLKRLHGGLEHLTLPAVVTLVRAARTNPELRGRTQAEQLDAKLADFEKLHGNLFPGVALELRSKIMGYVRVVTNVEGEVIRSGGKLASREDSLCIVLSGSIGVPAVQTRVLYTEGDRGAVRDVVVSDRQTLARVGENFGGVQFNTETGTLEKNAEPMQVRGTGSELTALTDCVYLVLRWQDYALITGQMTTLTVEILRKAPSERERSDRLLLLNAFKDVDVIQNVEFEPMKEQLVSMCRLKRIHNGEVLFKQGASAESFFIVVRGYVRAVVDGENVAVLGPGDSFGQQGVLGLTRSSRVRTATVIGGVVKGVPGAESAENVAGKRIAFCDLAEITRSMYMRAVGGSIEQVESILRKDASKRQKNELEMLANLLAQTNFFKTQLKSSLVQLKCCRVLKLRRLHSKETLFSQGDHGDEFFIVLQGSLVGEVASASSGMKTFGLGPGDSFGELSVTGQTAEARRRTASVSCGTEDCLLAVLSREDYLYVAGKLESVAMKALYKAVPADTSSPGPHERTEADTNVIWSYLKDLPFLSDLRYPHLQRAVCSRLQLKTIPLGTRLLEEGRCYPGNIYFLLRGGLNVLGANGNKLVDTYRPVTQFVDSPYALQADIPGEKEATRERRVQQNSRANKTLVSVAPQGNTVSRVLRISNFPPEATAEQLRDKFAKFGKNEETCISSVKIWSTTQGSGDGAVAPTANVPLCPDRKNLWATVEFRDKRDSMHAERDGVRIVMRGHNSVESSNPGTATRTPKEEDTSVEFVLNVDGEIVVSRLQKTDTETINSSLIDCWPSNQNQGSTTQETVLAVLSRNDYLNTTISFLQHIIDILQTDVRDRTLDHLEALERMFENTAIFNTLSSAARSSGMLRRNICRYIGCQIVNSRTKDLPKKGQASKKMLVVLSGEVYVDFKQDTERILTAGHAFGQECLVAPENHTLYESTLTCRGTAVLAVIYKDDYVRAANTAGIQHIIDQFWALGMGVESSQDDGSDDVNVNEEAEQESTVEVGRDREQQNKTGVHTEPVFTFKAYEALHPRIAKVLAPKDMFSLKERRQMLKDEWENDKALFGSKDRDYLLKAEFSMSMYELIDSWCMGVESIELYESLLEIIYENITTPIKKTHKKKRKHAKVAYDKPVQLGLKPMKAIQCCFQQMMDKRYAMSKKVRTAHSTTSISKEQVRKKNQKKDKINLTKMVATKSIIGAAGVECDAKSPEELIKFYKAMFDSIDTDGSGCIDRKELGLLAEKIGREMDDNELDAAMIEMDNDNSGEVDFDEFFAWFSGAVEHDRLIRDAFDRADLDDSGSIERAEIKQVLRDLGETKITKAVLDSAMKEMDPDGSGEVSYEEFKDWWTKQSSVAVLTAAVASDRTDPREVYVKRQFDKADSDSSGSIDRSELAGLLENLGRPLSEIELATAFELMDEDKSGQIEWQEFRKWFDWLEHNDTFLCRLFRAVDKDDSGTVERGEVVWVLKALGDVKRTVIDVDEAWAYMDQDGSGEVDIDEFENWWIHYCSGISDEIKLQYRTQHMTDDGGRQDDESNEQRAFTGSEIHAIKKIQNTWRNLAEIARPKAVVRFELAGKEQKLAQQGNWQRGRSRVIIQAQMRDYRLPPTADNAVRVRGADAAVAVDKQIKQMIENVVSAIDAGGASISKLWAFCKSQCIDTFGLDDGNEELQTLKSAICGLSVKDVYKAIDIQQLNETAQLWEVVYTCYEHSSVEEIKAVEDTARTQLFQYTPVHLDDFETQLAEAAFPELKTMCARLAASMDDKMWAKPDTLDKQAEVLALDLILHMVETEQRKYPANREADCATLPAKAHERQEHPEQLNVQQEHAKEQEHGRSRQEHAKQLDLKREEAKKRRHRRAAQQIPAAPAPDAAAQTRISRRRTPRPPLGTALSAASGHNNAQYREAGTATRRPSIASRSSQALQYHDDGSVRPVSPGSSSAASDATVLSFSSVTAVEQRAKMRHRYGFQDRPGSGRATTPTLVPTFDLLALLGKRAEEQNENRVKTPQLRGLKKEQLRWKDKHKLDAGTVARNGGAAPVLQPGTSVVAPLTKAQQRRLRKAENAAWKNRRIHQVEGLSPYDDFRTSIGGTVMIAQTARPALQRQHLTSYSARGVAGEADSMERRGTVASARLGSGASNTQQHTAAESAETQVITSLRNLSRSNAGRPQQLQHNQHKQQLQRHQHAEQAWDGRRPFILTKKNKILGPIRAPSPIRHPLPTPRRTASPVRGLLDVFPDGTRMTDQIRR